MYYIVKFENNYYANSKLFYDVVTGGERTFMRWLGEKRVEGTRILDNVLYPLTVEQRNMCTNVRPEYQDFDAAFSCIKPWVKAVGDVRIITLAQDVIPELYTYRNIGFCKLRDIVARGRYYAMSKKMAALSVCGWKYVALNAINTEANSPVVVTIVS